ncbi:MAG TPA: twin-arginine translocase subunit TatB [Chloroflexi bacterium]|nr:twin-arginine translocase subunit TatB [Chloroflexota bacterium]
MNFGGIGGGELLVILLIALIVFGPGRLVEIASSLGKALREFRKMSQDLTTEIQKELEVTKELQDELKKELQPLTAEEVKKEPQTEGPAAPDDEGSTKEE